MSRNRHCGLEAFGTGSIPTCRLFLSEALLVECNIQYVAFDYTDSIKAGDFELPLKTPVDDQEGEVTEIDERVIFCDCSVLLTTIDAEHLQSN